MEEKTKKSNMGETKLEEVIEKEEGKWRSKFKDGQTSRRWETHDRFYERSRAASPNLYRFKNNETGFEYKETFEMIKVFGDLHPYTFYVTYGHSEDSFMSKDADYLESKEKSEPFDKLIKMCDADKEAEGEFLALLSKLEKEKPAPSVNEALQELKKECAQVLKLFDKTVSLCQNYFSLEFNECRKRTEWQKLLQKPMLSQVEKFISDVEETGDLELHSLREHIATCMFDLGSSWSKRVDDLYEEKQKKPLVMELWCGSAYTLSSKDVRDTFLVDQKEMTILWQKAFDDLIMLATELEKYRYNYNLTKSRLEREIFWMSREYRENMPELTRIQRNFAFIVDKKVTLKKELKSLGKEILLEQCKMEEIKNKFSKKINCMRHSNKLAKERLTFKHQHIFDIKRSEVVELLATILKGDKFVHEEILNVTQEDIDLSFLTPEDIKKIHALSSPNVSLEAQINEDLKRKIPTLHDDEFADAFCRLVSSRNLISLLNLLTDELAYTLDLHWVQYIAETLDICTEIKWIELFKVFQINFVEDIKELKEHMMKYCKLSDNGEVVFDIKGAVDGFLHFVWLKRQSSLSGISHSESELKFSAEYWQSFEKALPETCVWDCVTEILEKYREFLKTRCSLLELKLSLVAENEEFEKYLKNYNAYVYL